MTDRMPIKSVLDIEARLEVIRASAYDGALAHRLEDDLWRDVLASIAAGAVRPRALCATAILSPDIVFDRCCE